MKIRGNTVGTTLKPEKAIVKCQNLTEVEKAQARDNIGAVGADDIRYVQDTLTGLDGNVSGLLDSVQDVSDRVAALENSGGSGGASALIVTVGENNIASHTAGDIANAARNGKTAIMHDGYTVYNLLATDGGDLAWFGYLTDENIMHVACVLDTGEVERYTHDFVTVAYVNEKLGNIETALDHIIAMQNSLIGGDGS